MQIRKFALLFVTTVSFAFGLTATAKSELDFRPYFIDFLSSSPPIWFGFESGEEPDLSLLGDAAKKFKEVVDEAWSTPDVNFAGHYQVVHILCGGPCTNHAAVNLTNGRVIPLPQTGASYEFREISKLLVVSNNFTSPASYWVEYYVIENDEFVFLYKEAVSNTGDQ